MESSSFKMPKPKKPLEDKEESKKKRKSKIEEKSLQEPKLKEENLQNAKNQEDPKCTLSSFIGESASFAFDQHSLIMMC